MKYVKRIQNLENKVLCVNFKKKLISSYCLSLHVFSEFTLVATQNLDSLTYTRRHQIKST